MKSISTWSKKEYRIRRLRSHIHWCTQNGLLYNEKYRSSTLFIRDFLWCFVWIFLQFLVNLVFCTTGQYVRVVCEQVHEELHFLFFFLLTVHAFPGNQTNILVHFLFSSQNALWIRFTRSDFIFEICSPTVRCYFILVSLRYCSRLICILRSQRRAGRDSGPLGFNGLATA